MNKELHLNYEFLFELTSSLDKPIQIGKTPYGERIIYPVSGGTFEGPEIKEKYMPTEEIGCYD